MTSHKTSTSADSLCSFEEFVKFVFREDITLKDRIIKFHATSPLSEIQTIESILKEFQGENIQNLEQLKALYCYDVPIVNDKLLLETGGCSSNRKDPNGPFNLATRVFDLPFDLSTLQTHQQTLRLQKFGAILQMLRNKFNMDWIGIYRTVSGFQYDSNSEKQDCLIKESYLGNFSRAHFPLTEKFAKKSNNSTVALTKHVKLIENVDALTEGDPYYVCDTRIKSELCVPILDSSCKLLGIMDIESTVPHFFKDESAYLLVYTCYLLGKYNMAIQ